MNPLSRRALAPVLALAVVLLTLFAAAAFVVRSYVAEVFATSQHLSDARALADRALRVQLDEETGLRGFTSTDDPVFLEPYRTASAQLNGTFIHLHAALADHATRAAYQLADDAWFQSGTWTHDVADPLLAHPNSSHALALQRRGKRIVDRFRADMGGVDAQLQQLEGNLSTDVGTAVDRLNLFVLAAAATFVVLVFLYGLQLVRVAERLADQERARQRDAREKAELLAAFETEKRIADTLQDAFIHRPLPLLEPLRFSASYVPATEDTKVGGDWYDVIALSQHRVLFAIGDVTGHGIEAAVTMNVARQSLISAALQDSDPGAVLGRTNTEILSTETRLVTAIAGVADAATFEFTYSIAGHPPPILLEPGRPPRMLEFGSLPLGAIAGTAYPVRRVQSVPGALLVLYTDGAVEHSKDVIEGEELLLRSIDAARNQAPTDVASFVHAAIFAGRPVGDDVAILTIGFTGDEAHGLVLSADRAHTGFSSRVEPRVMPGDTATNGAAGTILRKAS